MHIVGILGMGSIGKTTITEVLFNKHSHQFDGCCFLKNVREEWKRQTKYGLQNKLLLEILQEQNV